MANKWGLGKGLDALLPLEEKKARSPSIEEVALEGGAGGSRAGIIEIPLEKIRANPGQARRNFDEAELAELADSIRENGIINPIIVEEEGDGFFLIVAGERRYRAAGLAGLRELPAIIRSYSEEKRMIVSLIENIQRADLNPIEEASAYRSLMKLTGLSQDEAALRVGKNRATVANALRLLRLPQEMQESLRQGEISPGHGRALLSVEKPESREALFRDIVKNSLSVREAERQAGALNKGEKKPEAPPGEEAGALKARDPELEAMEEKFMHRLGTKTVIKGDLSQGTILIDYYSMEDLERLYEILGGGE